MGVRAPPDSIYPSTKLAHHGSILARGFSKLPLM
jgi:hypothetical protein